MKTCKMIGTYVLIGMFTTLGSTLIVKTINVATDQGERDYIKLHWNNLKHKFKKD